MAEEAGVPVGAVTIVGSQPWPIGKYTLLFHHVIDLQGMTQEDITHLPQQHYFGGSGLISASNLTSCFMNGNRLCAGVKVCLTVKQFEGPLLDP